MLFRISKLRSLNARTSCRKKRTVIPYFKSVGWNSESGGGDRMRDNVDIAILGAGPYGLSIAAYLRALQMNFRIFGAPMHTWINQMPEGMCLKSDGFASTLYDPHSAFTLQHFCNENRIPYADVGMPVRLETFISYGREFQRRDRKSVVYGKSVDLGR